MLGHFYFEGIGVERQEQRAVHWFRKAADQKHLNATIALGVAYGNARGVDPSWRTAQEYYEMAIALGGEDDSLLSLQLNITNVRCGHLCVCSFLVHAPPQMSIVRNLTLWHSPRLVAHAQLAPLMGHRVELRVRNRLGGKRGVATDFRWYQDERKWRYVIDLDDGTNLLMPPESVVAEGGGGGGGGAGAGAGGGGGGGAGAGAGGGSGGGRAGAGKVRGKGKKVRAWRK